MFNSAKRDLVDIFLSAPVDQNPYFVLRDYLTELEYPNELPKWELYASAIIIVSFVTISLEAFYILYVLMATRTFSLGTKTSLGMWKFDTIAIHAPSSILFSILSIFAWSIEQSFLSGFVWATVCHCVSIWWSHGDQSLSTSRQKNRQTSVMSNLWWLSHLFFLLPLILVIAFESWGIHSRRLPRVQFERYLDKLRAELQKAGEAFNPQLYNPSSTVESLRQAKRYRPASQSKFDIFYVAFLCSNIFLLIVYLPLMFVSWRDLRLKTKVLVLRLQNTRDIDFLTLIEVKKVIKEMQSMLLYRSLPMVLDLFASIPAFCWIMYEQGKRIDVFRSGNSHAIFKFIFDTPIAVALNAHLLIVAWHSKKQLEEYNQAKAARHHETPSFNVMRMQVFDSYFTSERKSVSRHRNPKESTSLV
ncbi:hypothetical protein O181_025849 [Austropuccinia psidii MF-1]|uniref:Uncharacterized protein n=1 Tax=Austropuccinia psidii MF-1 TaxID=1389203 RepID=A0A9Q3CIV6_9BASI|nr:hypothetical protein [Austropuccinia psidii MF-1]